jgi:cytoskeletal protein CcmA (bactofilin family)
MIKPGEGSPTVIGKSVRIQGEVTGSEDLYLDGEIEGTVTLTDSRFTVGPNANVLADIQAQDVIVFGRVEGNIQATGRVELRQSATVVGNIFAARLSIEENAGVSGKVETSGKSEQPASAAPQEEVKQPSLYNTGH